LHESIARHAGSVALRYRFERLLLPRSEGVRASSTDPRRSRHASAGCDRTTIRHAAELHSREPCRLFSDSAELGAVFLRGASPTSLDGADTASHEHRDPGNRLRRALSPSMPKSSRNLPCRCPSPLRSHRIVTLTMTSVYRRFLLALPATALLLALPLVALADTSVTYHCEGEQTTEGGLPIVSTKEHVVQDYTVQLSKGTGRYWDWKERLWRPIHSVNSRLLVLTEETVGPGLHGSWRASIDRDTGAWSVMWAGGQHTTTIRGQCRQASYREPPR
jgi:hypothetical protein